MANNEKNGFWKNYGLSIFLVAVIIITALFIKKLHSPVDPLKTADNPASPITETAAVSSAGSPAGSPEYSVSREVLGRGDIIILTNKARNENGGLTPLRENQLLDTIAESRAKDMLEKQYFAHVSPTGEEASDIARSVGYSYKIIAENIGSGDFISNQKIVDGWMQSPGHKRNILSPDVEDIGVAVLRGKMKGADTYIAVQIFGLQSPPVSQKICAAPSQTLLNEINQKRAQFDSMKDQLDRLRNELETERESIERERSDGAKDRQSIENFNVRIKAHNEKSDVYNRLVNDAKAKSDVLKSMVDEYNKTLKIYNDCEASR